MQEELIRKQVVTNVNYPTKADYQFYELMSYLGWHKR